MVQAIELVLLAKNTLIMEKILEDPTTLAVAFQSLFRSMSYAVLVVLSFQIAQIIEEFGKVRKWVNQQSRVRRMLSDAP